MLEVMDELEQKLKRLELTEFQERVAIVLLQMDGKQYKSQKEIVAAIYGAEAIRNCYGSIREGWKFAEKKISLALSLPAAEWVVLTKIDQWWRFFDEQFGQCALSEIKMRQQSLMPGAINKTRYWRFQQGSKLENQLRELALTSNQEFIAERVFQLTEQRQWTMYQLTKVWIQFKSGSGESLSARQIENQANKTKRAFKAVEKKVKSAIKLSKNERTILEALSAWYKRLFRVYPLLSEPDVKFFFKDCYGVSGKPWRGWIKKEKPAKSAKKDDDAIIDAFVSWKKALSGSRAGGDSELIVPAAVLNREMSERVFYRGMKIINHVAEQLRGYGIAYGFEIMDLVQEAGAVWWAFLKEWPGGTEREFDGFVKKTAESAIRAMFSHPALVGPSCAVPTEDLRKFMKEAVQHQLSYGEDLSLPELREKFGWDGEQFKNFQDLIRLSWRHFVSITESAFDDKSGGETKEARICSGAMNPEEELVDFQRTVTKDLLVAWIEGSLNSLLTPQEQLVLRYRFGFNSEEMESMDVEQVAEILATPVQVIVQLEDGAIAKLRANEELRTRYQVSLKMLKQMDETLK